MEKNCLFERIRRLEKESAEVAQKKEDKNGSINDALLVQVIDLEAEVTGKNKDIKILIDLF